MRHKWLCAFALLIVAVAAHSASGQHAEPAPASQPAASEPAATAPTGPSGTLATDAAGITFNFKGATFQQVIDFFSRVTGLPVIWETPAPEGSLDYISPRSYDRAQALSVLNIILQSRGVMLRVSDNMLYLQKLDDMKREDVPTFIGTIPAEMPAELIVTVVRPLEIALAKPIAERLANMVATYGSIAAMEQQNALVITETAANARRLLTIIDQLDLQDPDGSVEIFPVRHARAIELMTPLKALLSQKVEKFVINQQGQQVKIEEDQMPGLTISADERTNAIIAKGAQNKIDKLGEAINLLDVPATERAQGRAMATIALAALSAGEAAAKLNQLFAKVDEKIRPSILAMEDTARVMIVGSDEHVAEATRLLRELDGGNPAPDNAEPIVVVVPLEHAPPTSLLTAVASLLNKRQQSLTKLLPGPDGRSVIIAGPPGDVESIKAMIPVLDRQSAADRQVRLVRLAQGDPRQLIDRAQQLFSQQRAPEPDNPQWEVAVELDAESRLVTLIGAQRGIEAFTSILRQLEGHVVIDREARRFELAHLLPSELVAPLTSLAQQMLQPDDGAQYIAPAFSPIDQLGILVVSATPPQLAALETLITSLDVAPGGSGATGPLRLLQLRVADAVNVAAVINQQYGLRPAAERKARPVNVAADPQTNSLILAAHPDVLPEIQAMVEELNTIERPDEDGEPREIRVLPLRIARAEELAATVNQMFPQAPAPVDVRGRAQPHLQKPRELLVHADRQTNALILSGRPAAVTLAEQIVQQLDADPAALNAGQDRRDLRAVRVITLVNADAQQLATNLEAVFSTPDQLEQKPLVRVDPISNSLLVRATSEQFKTIEDLVSRIDQASIASTRQVRMIPVDRSKISAQELAQTLQRMLQRAPGTGGPVEVISLDDLINRQSDGSARPSSDVSESKAVPAEQGAVPAGASSCAHGFLSHPVMAAVVCSVVSFQQPGVDDISEAAEPEVSIAVDPASNSLVLLGSARAIERVAALIEQIQRQLPAPPSAIRYLPLPARLDAQQMASVINAALERYTPPGGQAGDLRRRTAVVVDAGANALVISAGDIDFQTIADLIAALSRPTDDELPVRTITLERAEAAAVATAIQQFYDDRAKVAAANGRSGRQQQRRVSVMGIDSSNTLLVSAADQDFEQVQELVRQFDTPEAAAGLTFRVFALQHAKAGEIERTVQDLVSDLTWNQGPMWFPWQPQRQTARTDTLAVRADPRLNALIVTGRGDKFDVVEQMIDILDAPPPEGERKVVRLYRVTHAPLQTTADLVREVFNTGRQRRSWEPPDPNEVRVRLDEPSSTLIVSATARDHEDIASMVKGVDEQLAQSSADAEFETKILPVKFGRATDLAATLNRFLTDRARATGAPKATATILPAETTNALVVAAPAGILATVRDLLGQLDKPEISGDRAIEIVALQQGDSQEVARIVREQFGRRATPGSGGVIVTADVRTNSIIINAPPEEFAQAKALIERMDAPGDAEETVIRTYALKAAQATEAVRVLTQALQLDDRGRTPGQGVSFKLDDAESQAVEVKARIVADKRSNSLIVTATPASFPVIESIVRKLDDVPAASPLEWRIIKLDHAMAPDVAQSLGQITRNLDDGQPQPRIDFNRLENKLVIAATADQFRQIERMLEHLDQPMQTERVTDFVPLQFAEAEKIQEALSMFYGPLAAEADTPGKRNVRIVADPATNSLVISAAATEWDGIRALLGRLDSAEYDSSLQLKVMPLLYADAGSVARAINDAFQTTVQQSRRGGGQNRSFAQPAGGGFLESFTMLVQADEWVRASAEPQTNAVIVTASRRNMLRIEDIVKQLDVADYASLPQPQVITLQSSGDPVQLAQSLTQLYVQSRPGGAGYPPLHIVGHAPSNSLIVRAEASDFEQIKALAEALQQQAGASGLTVSIVKLKAAPAARIAAAISEAFQAKAKQANQPLSIKVDAPGNSLVVASNAALLDEIKATVASLDAMAPAAGQGVFIIDLQNISPETARSVIQTIGLDKPQPADSTSRLVSEPVKVSLLPGAGRNAIVVLGNPADRETIVGLLKAIDADPPLAESQTRVILLRHAQAQALSQLLMQVLKPAEQQADTPLARAMREQVRRLSVQSDQPGGARVQLDLAKPVRIIADPALNALIVSSTYENVAALEELAGMFDRLPITDAVTVQIFPLQNIAAEQFTRIVSDLFAQGKALGRTIVTKVTGVPEGAVGKALLDELAITTDDRTNTVIVAGSEDAVALVEVLKSRIDNEVSAAWVEPRVIPLRFADADELAQTLQAIVVEGAASLPQSSPLQRQVGRLRMARRASPPGGATAPSVLEADVFVPMTRLVIRAEPHMNALVLVGTPDNLEVVSELVAMLDIESASPSDSVRIYPVTHASASRLAQTIKQLFDQQVQSKAIRPEDRVIVQADERTNALVVATSSRSFAVLEGMLKTLDSKLAPELREIRTIEVKNASAARVATIIQQMMDARLERLRAVQPQSADLERATVVADPRTNALIVAAGNDAFEVIARLAADLDTSSLGEASLISVIPLEKGNPERLAQTINQIMARRYADLPADLRNSQRPLIMTDARTNSLLVAASPEDVGSIQDLVSKLAAAPENPAVGVHLVPLGPGVRAELLAPRVQRLMAERQQSLGASGTPSDRVTIEPDLASNSLIVAASDENLGVVRGLIDVLSQAGGETDRELEVVSLRASRALDMIDLLDDLYVNEANRTRGPDTVRLTADERLNAVVINAPGQDVRSIKDLIAQLDGAKPASVVEIKYVPLQSANAVETVSLIENVLSGRGIGARRNPRQATVLKYLREIAAAQSPDQEGATTQPAGQNAAGEVEMEVSAAIRESITLTPDLRTNTIIVSAPRDSITMIERMIRDLDESSTGSKSIRIFKLVNADAIAMAEILTDLFRLRQGNSMYVLKPREEAGAVTTAALPSAEAPLAANPSGTIAAADVGSLGSIGGTELTAVPDERQQLSITVDSRTNSLIVSGTPTYLDLVSQVVEELDQLEANERETFVYQLRNAVAADVAQVLGEFVAQEQQKLISTLSADQLGSAARLLEREITIQGDEKSNTVLVSASPRYIERVREMIRQLDVDPPQVLIQVMLAEVTLDATDEWGVDMRIGGEIGSADWTAGYGLASAFVTGLGVPNIAITSTDFDLLIRAMKSQGRLQVLSNPSIMAANNAPARIQVGETVRIPTTTSISDAGRTSSTLEKEDLGVILEVTPSINPDGFVRMTITPEISNLSARTTQISEDFESPIITRRTADTTVTVHDGQTIVIGGLISDRFEKRDRKVPLLGDIPIVGALFRAEVEETAKTELLIVLTPHVIESPAQFSRVGEITEREIDRLTLPDDVKDQIRKSLIDGTGGLYDANGDLIELKEEPEPR